MHTNGRLFACLFTWPWKCWALLNPLPHKSHIKRKSSLCSLVCCFNVYASLKTLGHWLQRYEIPKCLFSLRLFSDPACANCSPHNEHFKGLSWVFLWRARLAFNLYVFPQSVHTNLVEVSCCTLSSWTTCSYGGVGAGWRVQDGWGLNWGFLGDDDWKGWWLRGILKDGCRRNVHNGCTEIWSFKNCGRKKWW